LNYSRSQLYEILDGRITRPPEWDRLVEPLVRLCTDGDRDLIEGWRRRYDVLVAVHQEIGRRTAADYARRADPPQAARDRTVQLPTRLPSSPRPPHRPDRPVRRVRRARRGRSNQRAR
jgi:hypothetical protein